MLVFMRALVFLARLLVGRAIKQPPALSSKAGSNFEFDERAAFVLIAPDYRYLSAAADAGCTAAHD